MPSTASHSTPHPVLELHAEWDGFPVAAGPQAGVPEAGVLETGLQENRRPVLVLLHGFTGSAQNWAPLREALRAIGPTLAVDLAGHGASPAPPEVEHYTVAACLDQLQALLGRLGIGAAWWLGYSMGGRIALQVAAHRPALVEGLILESATAGIAEPDLRAGRRQADEELADSILAGGLEAFVERWLANPLFQGLRELPPAEFEAQRGQRLAGDPLGLANSLRGMGAGAMEPVWERLPQIAVPALVLAGERDAKFSALAREMCARLPRATRRLIPGSGHVPHVERPGEFLRAVNDFFAAL